MTVNRIAARAQQGRGDKFSEQSLRDAVVNRWGEHGAHVEVLDMVLSECADLRSRVEQLGEVVEWAARVFEVNAYYERAKELRRRAKEGK